MTDINELAQRTDSLMDNALETAKQLRELQESSVAEAIFESIVENENGKEIQFERPISDLAFAAFLQLERLVEALEKAQQHIALLESRAEATDKLQDSAYRDGLKAGFSFGQTDDQIGFAQCLNAYSARGNNNG